MDGERPNQNVYVTQNGCGCGWATWLLALSLLACPAACLLLAVLGQGAR